MRRAPGWRIVRGIGVRASCHLNTTLRSADGDRPRHGDDGAPRPAGAAALPRSSPRARRGDRRDPDERGVRHRRAPASRPAVRGPVSDHPRPRQLRPAAGDRGRPRRRRGAPAARRTARHLLRRVRHLRRLLALPGGAGGDSLSAAPRLRDHDQRERRASRRLGRSHRAPAGRADRAPAGRHRPAGVHGWRLRPAHRVPCRRARGRRPRRHRRRAGQRSGRPQRRHLCRRCPAPPPS